MDLLTGAPPTRRSRHAAVRVGLIPRALLVLLLLLVGPGCDDQAAAVDRGPARDALLGRDSSGEGPLHSLLLRGATIIDGTGAAPIQGMSVLIRGERISSIVTNVGELAPNLEVIDLTGLTLLPGFIDSHVHVGLAPEEGLQGVMDQLLEFGVTSIRDVGGDLARVIAIREMLTRGEMAGPRMRTAGPMFTAPGGHPIKTFYQDDEAKTAAATRAVTDPAAARAEVRALSQAGVDLIKAILTDCAAWEGCQRLDPMVLAAIVEEAHSLGLQVAVHTDKPQDVDDAISAGADSVEHGVTDGVLEPPLVQRLANTGTVYIPTMGVVSVYSPTAMAELVARLARLREGGVKIAVGTDAPNDGASYGASYHRELVHLVEAGFSAMEALEAATRWPAERLGWQDLGTIAPGKLADLIAVAGDPLRDISVVHDVRLVIKGGRILRSRP